MAQTIGSKAIQVSAFMPAIFLILLLNPAFSQSTTNQHKLNKEVQQEHKNAQTETQQKTKQSNAQHQLQQDQAAHRNAVVIAKDKTVVGYHKTRLQHEEKRGSKLENKIQTQSGK